MRSRQQRIQTLYEISLAIETQDTLEETADKALAAYLQKLNCSVGAVFRAGPASGHTDLSLVTSIPANPERNDLFQAAYDRLTGLVETATTSRVASSDGHPSTAAAWETDTTAGAVEDAFERELPVSVTVDDTDQYHLLALPNFGVLLLGKQGGSLDTETVSALAPLNEKLAKACQSNVTSEQLRTERDRFEAVFDAIPEPVVNVVIEDGIERILRTNTAFRETFGYEDVSLRGRNLNSLIVSEDEWVDTAALVDALAQREPLTDEIERQTATGTGHFLFSAVPVTATDRTEYFGVYVDITEQKEREQTLEDLHVAAQDILGDQSRQRICTQTVEVIESVLGYSSTGVHLYDRDTEALEPVATTEQVHERLGDGPPSYTDRETAIWQAYEREETVKIDDIQAYDGALPAGETPTRSAVILPIGVHGVLITSAYEPRAFDGEDVYFLRLLGQLVDVALDRAVSEEGLETTQRTIRESLRAETHEEMANVVLDEIPDMLDLPVAGIWKHRPAQQTLEPLSQTKQANELFGQPPVFSNGDSLAWETFETGTTTIVSDVSEHPEAYNPGTPVKGEIIVPIGDFGVLTAGSTYKNSFSELDADILEILATNLEVVAEVIDNRQDIDLLDQVIARVLRHNVRNKLTPIRGYADEIVEKGDEPMTTYAEQIVKSCTELKKTADHAREMRKIVQNRSQVASVSLGTEVRAAAAAVEQEFPDCELVSHIEATPDVTAHPEIATAFRHLIRNGFEHNESAHPRVEITVEQRQSGITVEISDNGPGIDSYELGILDEHSESALDHGSGAGLWIVDRVLEYSEALLEFDVSEGTTATITFSSNTASHASDR
jgi:PAS domain S-box-containing protein